MYTRILVPLDGSKRAEAILPHVEELALRADGEVILLRVVEPSPVTPSPAGSHLALEAMNFEQQSRAAQDYLACKKGEFREKGIQVRTHVAYGMVVGAILEIADREDADLIAMASHGRSGLARVFYGSVAAGVLHRIDRPLLLIRSGDIV